MRHKLMGVVAAIAAGTLATSGFVGSADGARQVPDQASKDKVADLLLRAGLQTAPKHSSRPTVKVNGKTVNAANPYLAQVADPTTVDWSYWRNLAASQGAKRSGAATARTISIPTPFAYDEKEPAGEFGSNDTQPNAEAITKFGLGSGKTAAVRILGELNQPAVSTDDITTAEDQGAIPIATDTGIPADQEGITVSSEIGDGPHGSAGTDSGDFDFYKLTAAAGQVIRANTFGSDFDTLAVVYDSTGEIVAANDDADGTLQSEVSYNVETSDDYYVMVSGYAPFAGVPEDPFDSSSGTGSGAEGAYDLTVTAGPADYDFYAVRLKPGDVLGGTISGNAADIVVHKFDGSDRVGSTQDASFIYPIQSPLPGGNPGAAYVAEEAGLYAVSTGEGDGAYQMHLEVYRPGSEYANKGAVQTIFLDFDGARVNTAVFGGPGQSTLSPLASFLARWGLPASDENKLINRVVATVKENIRQDLIANGLNGKLKVNVKNSRDHKDPFGKPNVSRVIIGGTIAQSGVDTIGIAQSIDPGNFAHEETALVLLDIVSDPDTTYAPSFNAYLTPASDKVKFIGTALGNVTSHEVGHFVGSFHVDQFNDVLNLMDQGGNFPLLYGVGDDGIGGTADDPDVDFGIDTYNPNEGFTGLENTLNNSAWAFVPGQ